eukprot:COSAG04_NODE_7124_length_1186_cov_1.083717_1_plen_58_part_10
MARELSVSREDADAHKGRSDALESELRVARGAPLLQGTLRLLRPRYLPRVRLALLVHR